MKIIFRKWVFLLPPPDDVFQVEVYKRKRKTEALAITTFSERLIPFFLSSTDVLITTIKLSMGVGVFVVLVVVEMEVLVIVGEDMRMQLLMRK